MGKRRIIVAITGASGACYGVRALEMLRDLDDVETHLIISSAGLRTAMEEGGRSADEIRALADVCYPHKDIGAALASGSFKCEGMLVAPCSIKTLSAIAHRKHVRGGWHSLYSANKRSIGKNPNVIHVGQRLRLPR